MTLRHPPFPSRLEPSLRRDETSCPLIHHPPSDGFVNDSKVFLLEERVSKREGDDPGANPISLAWSVATLLASMESFIAASRTLPRLPSGWGCRGRLLATA